MDPPLLGFLTFLSLISLRSVGAQVPAHDIRVALDA
jgi:hypothetical protein